MELAQTAVSSASGRGLRVSVDLPFSAFVSPCFPMGVSAINRRFCHVADFAKRFLCTSEQNLESDRLPSSSTPHSRQHLVLVFRATVIPSRHCAEHHSPGSSFRVQRTEPSNWPHLSQASVIQMPRFSR